jgi:hypothetical protein
MQKETPWAYTHQSSISGSDITDCLKAETVDPDVSSISSSDITDCPILGSDIILTDVRLCL